MKEKELYGIVEHLYTYENPYYTMENKDYIVHYNKLFPDRAIFFVTIKKYKKQLYITKELDHENTYRIIEAE